MSTAQTWQAIAEAQESQHSCRHQWCIMRTIPLKSTAYERHDYCEACFMKRVITSADDRVEYHAQTSAAVLATLPLRTWRISHLQEGATPYPWKLDATFKSWASAVAGARAIAIDELTQNLSRPVEGPRPPLIAFSVDIECFDGDERNDLGSGRYTFIIAWDAFDERWVEAS